MHLIAITEIPSPFGKTVADVEMAGDSFKKGKGKIALEFCEKMMAEPMPDYPSDDESSEESRKEQERNLVREQIKNNAETGKMFDCTFYIVSNTRCYIKLMKKWGREMVSDIKEHCINTLHMEMLCLYGAKYVLGWILQNPSNYTWTYRKL